MTKQWKVQFYEHHDDTQPSSICESDRGDVALGSAHRWIEDCPSGAVEIDRMVVPRSHRRWLGGRAASEVGRRNVERWEQICDD